MLLSIELSVLVLLCVTSVFCEEDATATKNKREASIGSFSYTASDISKHDGSHVKTLMVLKSLEMPRHEVFFHKKAMGKTTVEYWPPDMDKEKFFSMKGGDLSLELWPSSAERETSEVIIKEPASEKLPNTPATDAPERQEMVTPTESVVINDVSITDAGPIVFPTLEPTTRDPERKIVYIPRNNGNKKRKLKKKAKPAASAVETSQAIDPISVSVNGVDATNEQNVAEAPNDRNIPEATPIYEIVDESPQDIQDIFQPTRYTEVIDNLSNLTELTYGTRRANNSDNQTEIVDAQQPTDNDNTMNNVSESESNNLVKSLSRGYGYNSTRASRRRIPAKPLSIEDLTPMEKLFTQLKSAIDERDVAKIKNIVRLMEEPAATTEAATVSSTSETTESTTKLVTIPSTTEIIASTKQETTATSTSQPPTISTSFSSDDTTTARSKIYLAPRVRLAQKKLRELKEKESDEKAQSNETAATESAASVRPTTTERMPTVSIVSSLVPTRPRRRSRSHITPKIRNIAARSRQAAKHKINLRIGRRVA